MDRGQHLEVRGDQRRYDEREREAGILKRDACMERRDWLFGGRSCESCEWGNRDSSLLVTDRWIRHVTALLGWKERLLHVILLDVPKPDSLSSFEIDIDCRSATTFFFGVC